MDGQGGPTAVFSTLTYRAQTLACAEVWTQPKKFMHYKLF